MTDATDQDQDRDEAEDSSVVTAPQEVEEDLTIAQGIGLPPIPKGFPAPFRLWHHG